MKPKLPFIPGSEVSGKVIEVGRDVRTVIVGDSVSSVLAVPHIIMASESQSAPA